MIVPAFPGTLLLSQWIATKAILGKTGTNHIPVDTPGVMSPDEAVHLALNVLWCVFSIQPSSGPVPVLLQGGHRAFEDTHLRGQAFSLSGVV